jgi:acyl-CoA synthetase (AMP-forming)/AMP-acid ligase II
MSVPSDLLEILHAATPGRTAVILPETGIHVTYQHLRDQVLQMADDLARLGIERGDRVATVLPNGLPAIVTFLAASIAGTAAPLNPGYRPDEFGFYLADTAAKILLVPPDGVPEARQAAQGKVPMYTVQMDESGFVRLLDVPASSKKAARPRPDNVALVLHTSGSTGHPKRVPISHANLGASAHNTANTYELSPNDISVCVMPLFHVHGLVASVLSTFLSGGTAVIPTKFSSLSFWKVVRDTKATWYSAVPTIHRLLLTRAAGQRPAGSETLRFVRSCSAALPSEMMKCMERVFGAPVLEAYGMTEAAHQMCSNPVPPKVRKPGSVGPGTGVKISVVDAKGNHLPAGRRGEILIQGPNVVREYENNPEANAKSFVNGWFRTGDQGHLDEDGYLVLTGRLKEMINRGGEKIAPREIDEVLLSHPAVVEAVAFGVPHATWGEEVEAAIVLRFPENETAILAHCKERLAEFKRPKKVYIVEKIPRTATGKIRRKTVAAAFAGEKK